MILVRGGRLIDPASGTDSPRDLLVDGGTVAGIEGPGVIRPEAAVEVIDAAGLAVLPGIVDVHVHLREPGFEYKETIASGTRAAAAGGVTSVCCMPNTRPINDCRAVTRFIVERAAADGAVNVFPIGAATKGSEGEGLSDIGELVGSGCVAVSDDGRPIVSPAVMRRVLEYSRIFDIPVVNHCEDLGLSAGGVMNEGKTASALGLRGIPGASEEVMARRDIALAELTGARLHVAHVSTAGTVRAVREAKARGVRVTAETCPHYFLLTDEAVERYNTNAKMNPPLRSADDRQAIREGLADGTIDAICTDHAPHHADEKEVEFDRAPFGIVGLETLLPLSLVLWREGVMPLMDVVRRLTQAPAEIMKLDRGRLAPGLPADLALVDLNAEYRVDASMFHGKTRNTPFDGWTVRGRVERTLVGGVTVYRRGHE